MKKFVKVMFLFQALILTLGFSSNLVVSAQAVHVSDVSEHESEISLPDSMALFCILPENDSFQTHGNNYLHYSKRIIKAVIAVTSRIVGNDYSSVQYFYSCRQLTISLSIAVIIFPFNYFW